MHSIDVEGKQTNSSEPPHTTTTNTDCLRRHRKLLVVGIWLAIAVASIVMCIYFPDKKSKFEFQVDSLEARLLAASRVSSSSSASAPSSSPSSDSGSGSGFGLDVNITLSVINPKLPLVFGSLSVSLELDNKNKTTVLSSKTVDKFYQRSPGQVKVEMPDVQIFGSTSSSESELMLTVKVVGQYWPLSEEEDSNDTEVEGQIQFILPGQIIWTPVVVEKDDDNKIDKSDLNITCEGINISLPSLSNDVTSGGGSLPCSNTVYL